jgi:hypothetical protein
VTITFTVGTWIVPLIITILAFAAAFIRTWWVDRNETGYIAVAGVIAGMIWGPVAAVISLVSWLVWALWFK